VAALPSSVPSSLLDRLAAALQGPHKDSIVEGVLALLDSHRDEPTGIHPTSSELSALSDASTPPACGQLRVNRFSRRSRALDDSDSSDDDFYALPSAFDSSERTSPGVKRRRRHRRHIAIIVACPVPHLPALSFADHIDPMLEEFNKHLLEVEKDELLITTNIDGEEPGTALSQPLQRAPWPRRRD
jgi:hypothetical protein